MDEPTSAQAPAPGPAVPGMDVTLLYGRQRQSMVRLARLLTGSFEIAEELVQEAFIKLQHAPTVAENPDSYLRTIVTNLSWGHLRRLRLERALRPEGRIVVPAQMFNFSGVSAVPYAEGGYTLDVPWRDMVAPITPAVASGKRDPVDLWKEWVPLGVRKRVPPSLGTWVRQHVPR